MKFQNTNFKKFHKVSQSFETVQTLARSAVFQVSRFYQRSRAGSRSCNSGNMHLRIFSTVFYRNLTGNHRSIGISTFVLCYPLFAKFALFGTYPAPYGGAKMSSKISPKSLFEISKCPKSPWNFTWNFMKFCYKFHKVSTEISAEVSPEISVP